MCASTSSKQVRENCRYDLEKKINHIARYALQYECARKRCKKLTGISFDHADVSFPHLNNIKKINRNSPQ